MEGQSFSSQARAPLRPGMPAIPGSAAQPDTMRDQAGRSGMMAGATSQITQQVSQRPWTALALAVATGYAVGSLTGSSSESDTRSSTGMHYDASHDRGTWDNHQTTSVARGEYAGAASSARAHQASWPDGSSRPSQPSEPGMFSRLTSQFDDQIGTLKDTLLSSLLGLMHDTIRQDAPSLHREIERVRRERGGQSSGSLNSASTFSSSAQDSQSKDPFRKEHEQETY